MSDVAIQVPSGLTTDGLLGRRYFARVIDWVLVLILGGSLIAALAAAMPGAQRLLSVVITFGALLLAWIGYFTVMESSPWQATLGKRLLGLRVYDARGQRLKLKQAFVRSLVKDGPFILIASIPGGQFLSIIWAGAHLIVMHRSPVYQAIHDRAAGTWVAAPEATTQLHIA